MNTDIMVVGDLHGDWGRINQLINQKAPPVILQCGDFGWWPMLETQKPVLYGRRKAQPFVLRGIKPGTTELFWCDGNHEDHWSLRDNQVEDISYPGVTYCPRGTVATINGLNVLFIGGADSIDKQWRRVGVDWFPEELISHADLERCLAFKGRVDIVISHTCPLEFNVQSNLGSEFKYQDPSRKALSVIFDHFKPGLWYFGHWHLAQSGRHQGTYWQCLDYPGHRGKWWDWVRG